MLQHKKNKVCFIISSLEAGGAERVFTTLMNNFDYINYDVHVIILNNKNQFFPLNTNNLTVVNLGLKRAFKSVWKLSRHIDNIKPAAVFCTGTHLNVLVGFVKLLFFRGSSIRFIARQSNIPNLINSYSGLKSRFVNSLIRFTYNKFDYIVCQSKEMRQSLEKLYRIEDRRLVVISNPVEPFLNKIDKIDSRNIRRIISVGRLNIVKGHDRLIDVFSTLDEDYYLSIFGDGEMRDSLQDKIDGLGLGDRVKLFPSIKNVPLEISKCDLLVITSFTEGFPNVALEALTVGVPVVSYEVGGIREIVKEGVNGYVVPQGDSEGLRKALIHCTEEEWEREDIIRDVNERFGVKGIVERYCDLITK